MDLTREDVVRAIKKICGSGVRFVGHNIKYDSLLLRRNGMEVCDLHFDTMLAAYDCHGDWPFFNLPYVCKQVLGAQLKSYSDTVGDDETFLDMPLAAMVNHACQDADHTFRLYPVLSDQLRVRRILGQFVEGTMGVLRRLADLEYHGIAVDLEKVGRIRKQLLRRSEQLNISICAKAGRVVDVESLDDLKAVVAERVELRTYIGARRVTVPTLEQIAANVPLARHIVDLKRIHGRIARLESLYANVRNGRVYPLFNQISSRAGLVTGRPNVFGSEGLPELKSSFERKAREFFTDPAKSLETLGRITKDPLLQRSTTDGPRRRSRKTSLLAGVEQDDLLLRLAIGQSDSELARRFMTERSAISRVRYDLEMEHRKMFRWLKKNRFKALDNGYAENGRLRKYIDGLKSSDLARRQEAARHVVRWLVRY
jgi:hypothetical protein